MTEFKNMSQDAIQDLELSMLQALDGLAHFAVNHCEAQTYFYLRGYRIRTRDYARLIDTTSREEGNEE